MSGSEEREAKGLCSMRIAGLMQEKPQEKREALEPNIIPLRIEMVQYSNRVGSDSHSV